jgi:hypothetical protein
MQIDPNMLIKTTLTLRFKASCVRVCPLSRVRERAGVRGFGDMIKDKFEFSDSDQAQHYYPVCQ